MKIKFRLESFGAVHSDLLKEWDYSKNERDPFNLGCQSNFKCHWICKTNPNHRWKAVLAHRVKGVGCPYCSGIKLVPEKSLVYREPELAKEFHPSKNGPVMPEDVFASSGKHYWWLCAVNKRHEWLASPDNRRKGNGCPYCSGKKVLSDESFGALYPELLEEWVYSENQKDPFTLSRQSNFKASWRCKRFEYHEWSAPISRRVNGSGCPYCAGVRLHPRDSAFYKMEQDLINEYDSKLNNGLDLRTVSVSYTKAVNWRCSSSSDHQPWPALIATRVDGRNGCPSCAQPSVDPHKSLAHTHPYLIKEWHPQNVLTPFQVTSGSGRVVDWICAQKKDHVYPMRVAHRSAGHQCPKCKNYPTLPEIRLLSELLPYVGCVLHKRLNGYAVDIFVIEYKVVIEWDSYYYHKNRLTSDQKKTRRLISLGFRVIRIRDARLSPLKIDHSALEIITFDGDECSFETYFGLTCVLFRWGVIGLNLMNHIRDYGDFQNEELFETLRLERGVRAVDASLARQYPDVARYWHPTKNGARTADAVRSKSREEFWWYCFECQREWTDKLANITKRKHPCKACSGAIATPNYSLSSQYPKIACELVGIDPSSITPRSGQLCNWLCSDCGYRWKRTIHSRTDKKGRGTGCPACAKRSMKIDRSVASKMSDSAVWGATNQVRPEDVAIGTHNKHYFYCQCGEEVLKRPRDYLIRDQRWCASCAIQRRRCKGKNIDVVHLEGKD